MLDLVQNVDNWPKALVCVALVVAVAAIAIALIKHQP